MKKTLLIIIFFICTYSLYGQSWSTPSADKNYILTRIPRVPIQNPVNLDTVSYLRMNNTIQYYDGIGRNLQVIKVKNSTSLKDEVQPFEYDNIGRISRNYLFYTDNNSNGGYKSNALTLNQGVYGFYKVSGQKIDTTTFPYGQTNYEESPLNRIIENGAAGKYWQPLNGVITGSGHTKKFEEGINDANEVPLWKITVNGANNSGFYALGALYKTISKNENWSSADPLIGIVKEYTNKDGLLILKRQFYKTTTNTLDSLSTFYIYDEMDNLAYVIPPAVNLTSFTENYAVFKEFIYAYKYDGRKRVVAKKVPGKGWMNLVYNKLDQIVLTQDSVQRSKTIKEWSFIKYDAFGRIILTGIYKGNESRDSAQARVNRYPTCESKGSFHGYTLNSYPKSTLNVLTAFYYDDYNFPSASASGFTYVVDSLNTKTDIVRGLLTGSKTKILGTNDSTLTVNYYDVYGRLIQSHSHNQVGGMDVINNKYAFTNQILVSKRVHTGRNSQSVTILKWYEYDHAGRKKKIRQKIGSDNVITLAQYNYNELGQLIEKNLHSTNGSTFAQSIDYRYNIQGWLRNINKADLSSDGGVTNDDSNDKFGMELFYETGANPQFNSNISAMNWKSGKLLLAGGQGYKFSYDHLDRLTRAITTVGPVYHENMSYDKMGNIQKLGRYSQGTLIDSLTYSYYNTNNSNQLLKIEDTGTTAGFNNGSTSSAEYTYDGNGNMLKDLNSGISTDIVYNYLNLPELLTKNTTSIKFTYDASGNKIKRRIVGSIDSIEYANGIQYTSGVIDFIQTEEGRAVKNGSSFLYRYNLTDHLGNLRVEIDASGTALQEESYYSFGLTQSLPGNIDPSAKNKYMYNGKEFQTELSWLDYGARFYDPTLGRWNVIDPLADKMPKHSTYCYAFNNPLRFIDPSGMSPSPPDDYVFNEKGNYVRTDKNNKPDRLTIENSKTGDKKYYSFNDSKTDVEAIKYNIKKFGEEFKKMKYILNISKTRINDMMEESDIYERNYVNRRYFTATQSYSGNMDFTVFHLSIDMAKAGLGYTWNFDNELMKDKGPIFIIDNQHTVYNYFDAGNWLWGNAVNRLGGTQTDALNWARKFNFKDSQADLNAIQNGWFYEEGFRDVNDCPKN